MSSVSASFLKELSEIPFDRLMHFQGRATDIPSIISVIEHGEPHASRMALVTLANSIEQKGALIMLSPLLGSYLFYKLQQNGTNADLIVRIILKLAKAVGLQWETFIGTTQFEGKQFSMSLYNDQSDYLWPEFVDKQTDELSWGTKGADVLFDDPWFYTYQVLDDGLPLLNNLAHIDLITQGFVYEITTIIHMVGAQHRKPLPLDFKMSFDGFVLEPLTPKYQDDLSVNLTSKVTTYLSFDSLTHPALLAQYLTHCQTEFARGAGVNLVILSQDTGEFLGCCGLHDINTYSIELGIWLKEQAQGKGIATKVIAQLIALCKEHFSPQYLIYSVQKGNDASAHLCRNLGFTKHKDFVLEPTSLKNSLRHMSQYRLDLSK